jgi:hypothetical protein
VTFYPNTPKYTQIQLQIILFWDVLWIINDLHCIYTLFFHEFQQNSQVFTDLGRVAYNHEYTTNTNVPKHTQNSYGMCYLHTTNIFLPTLFQLFYLFILFLFFLFNMNKQYIWKREMISMLLFFRWLDIHLYHLLT